MALERNDYYRESPMVHDVCKRYLYYHTLLTMTDGSTFDAIIEDVDPDNITVLVGEDVADGESENESDEQQRQYYGYHHPRRRFRRFRRRRFPLVNLATLSLLPYIAQPLYPYYPY